MSRSSRVQLSVCILLLVALSVLSWRLEKMSDRPRAPEGREGYTPPLFGSSIDPWKETVPSVTDPDLQGSGESAGQKPAEPFVERPDLLALASRKDRTLEVEEQTLIHLLHKARTEKDRLLAGEEDLPRSGRQAASSPSPALDKRRAPPAPMVREPWSRCPNHGLAECEDCGKSFAFLSPALSLERNDRVFQELLDHPEKYRGKLVEIKGNVVGEGRIYPLRLIGLDTPNSSGLDRAFQSYCLDTQGKFYLVATAHKRRELEHMDGVTLRAYFAQLYTGDVLVQGQIRKGTIPFLVGYDYEALEPPVRAVPSVLLLPLAAALGVVAFILVVISRQRSRRDFDSRRVAAKQSRLSGPGALPNTRGATS